MKKVITFLFFIAIIFQVYTMNGNTSFGIGTNTQWHRIRITESGLSFKEVQKRAYISPTIYFATKINPRFEISLDISYIRFKKTCQTNINYLKPTSGDEITSGIYCRFPMITPKINYQLMKKNRFSVDLNLGATYSFQVTGLTMTIDYLSIDSTVKCKYIGDSPTNLIFNPLIGLQTKFTLSKHVNLRLNVCNVFGGKKYIVRDQYIATDKNGNTRKLDYGLYGGYSCVDLKLVYTY